MQVLLVSPLPPPSGGIATWTKEVMQYFDDRRGSTCPITLKVVNSALTGKRSGVVSNRRAFLDEIYRSISILNAVKHVFAEKHPDVIHINSSGAQYGMFRDAIIARYARKRKTAVVIHFRCNLSDQAEYNTISRLSFRLLMQQADRVFVLNKKSEEYACVHASKNVEVVPNFTSMPILDGSKKVRNQLQNVLFVGHVRKDKGIDELLSASVSFPDVTFHLYGNVYDEYRNIVMPQNVVLHGNASKDEVRGALDEADLFILPSYSEGFSNALVEAMSRAVPCIATDVGANCEMLSDGCGICIPVKDSNALVNAISSMQLHSIRESYSKKAVAKCKARYTKESVCKSLAEKWVKLATNSFD